MPGAFTFSKQERLKSRKQTDLLFQLGRRFMSGSIRVHYRMPEEEKTGLKVGVSTSSRLFKRAVDRNRIKRQLREAFRLQKNELNNLLEKQSMHLDVFFIYTGRAVPQYSTLFEEMGKALTKLIGQVTIKK